MGKPYRPFDPRIYRSFRLFREFSSAIIDQWMTHGVDVIHMLTGELYPTSVVAHGALYHFHDYRDNADSVQVSLGVRKQSQEVPGRLFDLPQQRRRKRHPGDGHARDP